MNKTTDPGAGGAPTDPDLRVQGSDGASDGDIDGRATNILFDSAHETARRRTATDDDVSTLDHLLW
jgi:hypothetical protein